MLSTGRLTLHSSGPAGRVLVLALAATGCTPSGDDDGTEETAADPSPYLVDDAEPGTLDLTTAEAEVAIDAVLAKALSYEGSDVFDAYTEVMAYGDEGCPGEETEASGGTMWNVECTSLLGASFSGFFSVFEGTNASGQIESAMRAESTISTPDGTELVVAGDVRLVNDVINDSWYSVVGGVVSYNGPASVGTWMETTPDLNLEYYLLLEDASSLKSAEFNGSVGALDGKVSAVDFFDVAVALASESPCPEEPSGKISVRDADGSWGDVIFDVEEDDDGLLVVEDGACDGCGTLWFDGENVGQVCIDISPIFQAEMPPW